MAAKLLAGTPGEKHIPEVRRTLVACTKLPPLIMKKRDEAGEMDMLRECPRCKRRFSSETWVVPLKVFFCMKVDGSTHPKGDLVMGVTAIYFPGGLDKYHRMNLL